VNVLGIETSCDETAAAVVRDGRHVLSNVVYSQTALHGPYGGVVPEIASRCHVEALPGVVDEALRRPGLTWHDIEAVAVTQGPGLASSLLVGLSAAKGLALRLGCPLVAVHHVEAHLFSVFLDEDALSLAEACPFVALVVSGGHTCLIRVEKLGRYTLVGQTLDDAAGEAFDKGANLLGLGYPGGPAIDRASSGGDRDFVRFPRGRQKKANSRYVPSGMDPDLCFSFSGLKTALRYYLRDHPPADDGEIASLAAAYQEAIVDALIERCERAVADGQGLALAGGVALNRRLRERISDLARSKGLRLMLAEPCYCADNAAMVAGLAGAGQGLRGREAMRADADPNLPFARRVHP